MKRAATARGGDCHSVKGVSDPQGHDETSSDRDDLACRATPGAAADFGVSLEAIDGSRSWSSSREDGESQHDEGATGGALEQQLDATAGCGALVQHEPAVGAFSSAGVRSGRREFGTVLDFVDAQQVAASATSTTGASSRTAWQQDPPGSEAFERSVGRLQQHVPDRRLASEQRHSCPGREAQLAGPRGPQPSGIPSDEATNATSNTARTTDPFAPQAIRKLEMWRPKSDMSTCVPDESWPRF